MADAKFFNNLMAKRGYNKKGEDIVDGAVEIRLSTPFNSDTITTVRTVKVGDKEKSVCQVQGSFKVGEYQAKQLSYFFNTDVAVDTYLTVQVTVWDKKGEALAKFNLSEGDVFLFLASNMTIESFDKKDGTKGQNLKVTAYDFKSIRSANKGAEAGTPASKPAPSLNDFSSIDDSDDGDLPF